MLEKRARSIDPESDHFLTRYILQIWIERDAGVEKETVHLQICIDKNTLEKILDRNNCTCKWKKKHVKRNRLENSVGPSILFGRCLYPHESARLLTPWKKCFSQNFWTVILFRQFSNLHRTASLHTLQMWKCFLKKFWRTFSVPQMIIFTRIIKTDHNVRDKFSPE